MNVMQKEKDCRDNMANRPYKDMTGERYGEHRQIKKHRFDGTMLIEGGKYDNTKWMEERERYDISRCD